MTTSSWGLAPMFIWGAWQSRVIFGIDGPERVLVRVLRRVCGIGFLSSVANCEHYLVGNVPLLSACAFKQRQLSRCPIDRHFRAALHNLLAQHISSTPPTGRDCLSPASELLPARFGPTIMVNQICCPQRTPRRLLLLQGYAVAQI
jgi:hypothetical protein